MHVALEYAVPHLGLSSELMFGGLGKVRICMGARICWARLAIACSRERGLCCGDASLVSWCCPHPAPIYPARTWPPPPASARHRITHAMHAPSDMQVVETFINYTQQPMLVCAPMYAPYYIPGGELQPALAKQLGGGRGPILSFFAVVGAGKHAVDVYVTAAHGSPGKPAVFYLLLASDIFSTRTRGTIYQHERWVGEGGTEGQTGAAKQGTAQHSSAQQHSATPLPFNVLPCTSVCPRHPLPAPAPAVRRRSSLSSLCSIRRWLTWWRHWGCLPCSSTTTTVGGWAGAWAHGQVWGIAGWLDLNDDQRGYNPAATDMPAPHPLLQVP